MPSAGYGLTLHGSARPAIAAANSEEHVCTALVLVLRPKDPKESVMVITGGTASLPTGCNPDDGIGYGLVLGAHLHASNHFVKFSE